MACRRRIGLSLFAAAALAGTAFGCAAVRSPPVATQTPELVELADIEPAILQDIRYARRNNFVGRPLRGYHDGVCLLSRPAARALARAHRELRGRDLRLMVWDCYRPQTAVDDLLAWAADLTDQRTKGAYYPRIDKSRLVPDGYIAERSGHSRASTVDVTIVRIDGYGRVRELDMGTPYDFFDPLAATDAAAISDVARANRELLLAAMQKAGFRNYPKEWWHFTLQAEPYPDSYFDTPVRRR